MIIFLPQQFQQKMWNLVESNKIIGTHIKVSSYKNHMRNIKNAKSQLNIATPWKPSFSLSKRKNKYHKFMERKVERENTALLQRMLQIESEPMTNTCMNIPLSIPSNKITYSELKSRERMHTNHEIEKQNRKILDKIEGVSSGYGKHVWKEDWKNNTKYKNMIEKKEYVPDYRTLAREEENLVRSRQRPQSAIAYRCP